MKIVNRTFAVLTMVAMVPAAAASPRCADLGYRIERSADYGSNAAQRLASQLFGLGGLSAALNDAAQRLSSIPAAVDLNRELRPMLADAENSIRSAAQTHAAAWRELKRTYPDTEGLGSQVRVIAGRSAQEFERAKNELISAANKIAAIKTRVSQLHGQVSQQSSLEQPRQAILRANQAARQASTTIFDLRDLGTLEFLATDYVNSCSNLAIQECGRIRADVHASASRAAAASREIDQWGAQLARLTSGVDSLAASLPPPAEPVDLNALLNEYIDRSVLPPIQDAVNQVGQAARLSLAASQDESGVGYDQKAAEALNWGEQAKGSIDRGANGASGFAGEVAGAQARIGTRVYPSPIGFQQHARIAQDVHSRIDFALRNLGTVRPSRGDLGFLSGALYAHQRSCELR
jgi:hypothetical protein